MSASHAMFTTLIFTVNLVYQATTIGLNPMQLVLVGTTLEITAFIFQVPLGVFLLVFMPEGGFKKSHTEERTSWQQMAGTLRSGIGLVRRKPVLLTVLGVGAIYGLYSEGFDRLWRDHLQMNFTFPAIGNWQPVVWFGIISAILTVLSIGANEIARRRLDTNSHVAVSYALFGLNAVMVLGFPIFGLAGN